MKTRRQFLQITAATTGMIIYGCRLSRNEGQSPDSSGANKELYVYTWSVYTDAELLKQFDRETGFKTNADVFDSNEAMLARIQAGGGKGYSVIYPSDYMVQQMVELNLLTELDKSRLTGLDGLLPRYQSPAYDPENKHSIPISWGTTGFIYNPKTLTEAPKDWDYLWQNQQKLAKKMTLLNDVREVMGATLRSLGYSYNSTDPEQIKQAYEKLAKLKGSIASFTSDGWRSQIVSGDLLVAMCYSSDANELISENPDLQYLVPDSGSSLWTDTLAIPKNAPNPEAAYAWLNFMLKPENAAELCKRLRLPIPNQKALDLLPEELRNNPLFFPPDSIVEKCEAIQPVSDEISELYDRYWTQLTSG